MMCDACRQSARDALATACAAEVHHCRRFPACLSRVQHAAHAGRRAQHPRVAAGAQHALSCPWQHQGHLPACVFRRGIRPAIGCCPGATTLLEASHPFPEPSPQIWVSNNPQVLRSARQHRTPTPSACRAACRRAVACNAWLHCWHPVRCFPTTELHGRHAAACKHALQAVCSVRAAFTGSVQRGGRHDARRSAAHSRGAAIGARGSGGAGGGPCRSTAASSCTCQRCGSLIPHCLQLGTAARLQHGVRLTASSGGSPWADVWNGPCRVSHSTSWHAAHCTAAFPSASSQQVTRTPSIVHPQYDSLPI